MRIIGTLAGLAIAAFGVGVVIFGAAAAIAMFPIGLIIGVLFIAGGLLIAGFGASIALSAATGELNSTR